MVNLVKNKKIAKNHAFYVKFAHSDKIKFGNIQVSLKRTLI